MNETMLERLEILYECLVYYDRTLMGEDDVHFALVDVKLTTDDRIILNLLRDMEALLKEYEETLSNFDNIQEMLLLILDKVKKTA